MRKSAFKACLLLMAIMSPGIACAAGLGRLTVNSTLGQPFRAEIDLVAVKKEEKPSLTARLASQDTFRQANVDYSPLLSSFKTSIEFHPDGRSYVRIISSEPVAEPLLNMLVELNWSSGRLLREYTVLLPSQERDGHPQANPATQTTPPASAKAESVAGKPDQAIRRDGNLPVQDRSASESASVSKSHTVYGPVKPGDTLARIAKNIGLPTGISFNQMLVALHRANRNAFFGNNIHQLKTGPILRIPENSEIRTITPAEANQEVNVQTANWNRRKFGDIESAIDELKQVSGGKINLPAEIASASDTERPREVLKLSKGEESRHAAMNVNSNKEGNVGGSRGRERSSDAQDQLYTIEEDAIAKQASLQEASERIALLEKNIETLQQLLELRNPVLADMQKRAEVIRPISSDAGASIPFASSIIQRASYKTNTEAYGAENLEESTIVSSMTGEPVEIARPVRAASLPIHQSVPGYNRMPRTQNVFDELTANMEYLGGALVLLFTGIVGVSMARRPKHTPQSNDNENMALTHPGSASHDKPIAAILNEETYTVAQEDGANAGAKEGIYADAHNTLAVQIVKNASVGDCAQPEVCSALAASPGHTSSAYMVAPPEHALDEINLNMDDARFVRPSIISVKKHFAERSFHWHEIVSGVDLARAYQEMGDENAARQVLQEVMLEGDAQQQESARLILAKLEGAVLEQQVN